MSGFLTKNPKKIHSVPYFRIAKTLDFKTAACNMLLYQMSTFRHTVSTETLHVHHSWTDK